MLYLICYISKVSLTKFLLYAVVGVPLLAGRKRKIVWKELIEGAGPRKSTPLFTNTTE
jgi:hypothetical protein